jgi:ribose-phosphate pyrophosphokinase
MKILNCNNTKYLAEKILSKVGLELVNREINKFSDGELNIKIHDDLYQKAVIITHQLFPNVNENLMQLLFLINAVKKRGAKRIHVIIPYFAYGRMDHKVEPADFISASCIASLLEAAGLDTLITIDLHSSQIEGFFRVPVKNITMLEVFKSGFRDISDTGNIIVSPDIGGKMRITSISKFLNVPFAVIYKQRDEQNNVLMNGIMGDVKGKHCILIDDMIGSGQTIITAIDMLISAQAKSIEIIITHNLLGVQDPKKLNDIASRVNKISVSNSIQTNANNIYSSTINLVDISDSIIDCINLYFQ